MHRPLRAVLLALPLLAAARAGAAPPRELPDWLAADVEAAKLSLEPGELDDTCRKRTFATDPGLPCAQLALRRLIGLDVDVDLAESARLARQACKRENAQGCALLGWMLEESVGVERNGDEAEKAYQESCRASDHHPHGGGCFRLAARLLARRADRSSVTRALRASCAAQYQPACADAYPNGPDEFPPAPPQYDGAGVSEQRRLCGLGVATDCAALGDRASTGDGLPLSFRDAAAFYRKACEARVWGAAGCARLGVLFLEGNGVARDVTVARRLFDRACKAGVQDACERLGALLGPVDDLAAWCDDDDAACAPKVGSPRSTGSGARATGATRPPASGSPWRSSRRGRTSTTAARPRRSARRATPSCPRPAPCSRPCTRAASASRGVTSP